LSASFLHAQESGARYLIITHDNYYEALQPLAEWKTQKGMKAKIVKLSEIGGNRRRFGSDQKLRRKRIQHMAN